MKNHQLINQDSGNVEMYTPPRIIEAARMVMGSIDLDPASCAFANQTVHAEQFFTKSMDGLKREWFGNVWLNHPFGREHNADWINKLVHEYVVGDVYQACCITFASTSEKWTEPLFNYPICFLSPHTNYHDEQNNVKSGVTKGSMVTYLGRNVTSFILTFGQLGRVMLPA